VAQGLALLQRRAPRDVPTVVAQATQETDVSFIFALIGMAAAVLLVLLLACVFVRSRLGPSERRIKTGGR